MSRIGSWLRGPSKQATSSFESELDESEHLADSLAAATIIMNDDIDGAEARLRLCNSSFHQLGLGVTKFMRSLIGFEQDAMKEAAERLALAESMAWADLKKAQKGNGSFKSSIYPPGSEYALCHAQAQLMAAVVGTLNESLTDALRGFYKMRKAYITLDSIIAAENEYIRRKTGRDPEFAARPMTSNSKTEGHMPGGFGDEDDDDGDDNDNEKFPNPKAGGTLEEDDDSDMEFQDAEESRANGKVHGEYVGHTSEAGPTDTERILDKGQSNEPSREELDSALFTNQIDVFIHSGTNLCHGLMLLLISIVPPAFGKILSVIGFRGDRQRGIAMLWQSTRFSNINGAVAGLILMAYYNSLLGLCDILPTEEGCDLDVTGFPKARLVSLLDEMIAKYPKSRLWKVELARNKATNRDLEGAMKVFETNSDSSIRQIVALNMFEKALNALYHHKHQICSDSFIKCTELNSWSHALYLYIAGISQVELYRSTRDADPAAASKHKSEATKFLKKAPTMASKKKLLARPLPFDDFVIRKLQKWEERAQEWNVDLVDAIGVSPAEEMIYLWNGTKRMQTPDLELSLAALDWSRAEHEQKLRGNLDESGMHALLKATVLRSLGKLEESKFLLQEEVLSHDRNEFKGALKDDWTCPSAVYEIAVIAWLEKDLPGADHLAKVNECSQCLSKVAKWESYLMDARMGLKVTTAQNTVTRHNNNNSNKGR